MLKSKLVLLLITVIMLTGISPIVQVSAGIQASYYVDSVNGNDSNTGTLASPFRTIEKARDMVRTINSNMTGDIYVYLRGGTYSLSSTLAFSQLDSGTNGYYVYYKNYTGETPVISGGINVSGWTLHDSSKNIYKATVGNVDSRQLYVNGVRAIRARSAAGLPGAVRNSSGYTTTDISMQNWRNISDIEFVYTVEWSQMRCGVSSISGNTVTMKQPGFDSITVKKAGVKADIPTYIENAYELLDSTGEFYLDKAAGIVYYIPRTGENMTTANVVMPTLQSLVSAAGTLDSPVHHIWFEGITFSYATWLAPNGSNGFAEVQANWCAKPNALNVDNWEINDCVKTLANINLRAAKSIVFERNKFVHLGGAGLGFEYGSQDNIIRGNEFTDISGNALQFGDTYDHHRSDSRDKIKNNDIVNNYIHKAGAEYIGAVGIAVQYAEDTYIAHNEINDLPYSGISIGWGWGISDLDMSNPSASKDNKIMYNHVSNIMHTVKDGGGIYSLGAQPGLEIKYNVVHNQQIWGGAIYLDDGSRFASVKNNVIYDTLLNFQIKGNHHDVQRNFWTRENNTTQWPMRSPYTSESDFQWIIANNDCLNVENALPATIIKNAGLEAGYSFLCPPPTYSDTQVPSTPANLASPAKTDVTVDLTWTASTDNVAVTGYEIYSGSEIVGITNTTSYRVKGLNAATAYTFKVLARDAARNTSADSNILNVTTSAASGNVALNKPAYAYYMDGTAAYIHNSRDAWNAVDGDPLSYAQADSQYRWRLDVDLTKSHYIDRVKVSFPINPPNDQTLYATEYNILTSNDNKTWITAAQVTDSTGGSINTPLAAPVWARYVRIEAVKPDGGGQTGGQMAITELEVYTVPGNANLAQGKPASAYNSNGAAASMFSGREADKAVDGDLVTYSQSNSDYMWIQQVDLQSSIYIDKVAVTFPLSPPSLQTLFATSFNIKISTDGINWTLAASHTDAADVRYSGRVEKTFNPLKSRFVRIEAIKPDAAGQKGGEMAISEVEVYSANLALNKPASAYYLDGSTASMYSSREASKAVDGSGFTYAQALNEYKWIEQVDLQSSYDINKVTLIFPTNPPSWQTLYATDYYIKTSTDGINWSIAATINNCTGGKNETTFTTCQARYVRVEAIKPDSGGQTGGQMAISELEVYGGS